MGYSLDRVEDIFDRTSGYCHICGRKLAFCNYGNFGTRGAWEVEHSKPRCEEGTDRLCNLYPAHISCNRSKQTRTTRSCRAEYRRGRAPLSVKRREQARVDNAIAQGLIGGLVGAAIGGQKGFVLAAFDGWKARLRPKP